VLKVVACIYLPSFFHTQGIVFMLLPSRYFLRAGARLPRPLRLASLLFLLTLLAALVGACGTTTTSSGATPTAAATKRPAYVYVAIGDSVTFGTCATNPATDSWPEVLSRKMPAGTQVINLGIPGWTAHDALQSELPEAIDAQPNLATVWLGVNDLKNGNVSLDSYRHDLDTILTDLSTQTHARIAVANIPNLTLLPRFYSTDQKSLTAEVQAWNAAIAQEVTAHHLILLDVYSHSNEILGHPEYLCNDGLHPTTLGYQQIAMLFYQVLHADGVF
jgi:acyl-CoA thioesterase-1